jgi:hypothetical protein
MAKDNPARMPPHTNIAGCWMLRSTIPKEYSRKSSRKTANQNLKSVQQEDEEQQRDDDVVGQVHLDVTRNCRQNRRDQY